MLLLAQTWCTFCRSGCVPVLHCTCALPPCVYAMQTALEARGLYPDLKWVWANIGYMAGSALLMYGVQVVALSYLGRE